MEKADGPSAPSAPTEASKTPTSITLNGVAGQEYSRDNGSTGIPARSLVDSPLIRDICLSQE